jgi:dTDP-4-amino-4,6-dideoxygalactose transaminase
VITFANLARQHALLRDDIDAAIGDVLASGAFILGPRVAEFETAFAAYCGAGHGIAVNSGTSALHLALLAAGIGSGDEVITTAFTFVATVAAIGYAGARPVLVDIDPETFTSDVRRIEAAITPRTRAILPVHLYGHPADMAPILDIARRRGLVVIEDAAQAHGAQCDGRRVGGLGDAGCFSFYPSKNLGACGEGGMMVTSNPEMARSARLLRDWGREGDGHAVKGFNFRMDAIQGAILGVKLRHLDAWNAARRGHAARYDAALAGTGMHAGRSMPWARHAYHVYALRSQRRAAVAQQFRQLGIETRVHYPTPVHLTDAWSDLGYGGDDFPEAQRAAREVLSIPVHPELTAAEVEQVAAALRRVALPDVHAGMSTATTSQGT